MIKAISVRRQWRSCSFMGCPDGEIRALANVPSSNSRFGRRKDREIFTRFQIFCRKNIRKKKNEHKHIGQQDTAPFPPHRQRVEDLGRAFYGQWHGKKRAATGKLAQIFGEVTKKPYLCTCFINNFKFRKFPTCSLSALKGSKKGVKRTFVVSAGKFKGRFYCPFLSLHFSAFQSLQLELAKVE